MQPGERQFQLRLHTGGSQHLAVRGHGRHVLQQRGLAHSRFTVYHQSPAFTLTDAGNQPLPQRLHQQIGGRAHLHEGIEEDFVEEVHWLPHQCAKPR